MTLLKTNQLRKKFGALDDKAVALHHVDIEVQAGELLVLLGPSGCGKTTLLRCIAGLTEPTEGTIALSNVVVADAAKQINVPPNKRNLGMVFQSFALWPHMTVWQNVAYPLNSRGWNSQERNNRVREMLQLVHCTDLEARLPSTLSGGQQQRISLARALAARPSLILFDEPLSNLDALLRIELRSQLRLIHRETEFSGIYVTHDQAEAMGLGTRIAVMNAGRVEQIGSPQDIYSKPATEFVAEFMGMQNKLLLCGDGQGWHYQNAPVVDLGGSNILPTGEDIVLRVRPENITVARSDRLGAESPENQPRIGIGGWRIRDKVFQGDYVEYVLSIGNRQLKARMKCDARPFGIEDQVTALIHLKDAAIFRKPN